jgi:hypothetical protein
MRTGKSVLIWRTATIATLRFLRDISVSFMISVLFVIVLPGVLSQALNAFLLLTGLSVLFSFAVIITRRTQSVSCFVASVLGIGLGPLLLLSLLISIQNRKVQLAGHPLLYLSPLALCLLLLPFWLLNRNRLK